MQFGAVASLKQLASKKQKRSWLSGMRKMGLTNADKSRIIMVVKNLKKDAAGANRQSLTPVWLDWTPRYFRTEEEPDWN